MSVELGNRFGRAMDGMESFAYETNKKDDMDDSFDVEPDLFSDRALFEAIVEKAFSTDSSEMQLDDEFSSRGTSSPGDSDTPPSSSGGFQEASSPEADHDTQTFAQGALPTDMFAGLGGPVPNHQMRPELNVYDGFNTEQPFPDPFMGVPLSVQHHQSQLPAYAWGNYSQRPTQQGVTYTTYFSWTDPAAVIPTRPSNFCHPIYANQQTILDQSSLVPRPPMDRSIVPPDRNPSSGTDQGFFNRQEFMSMRSLQADNLVSRYSELSPPDVTMDDAGYQLAPNPPRESGFHLMEQPTNAGSHYVPAPEPINDSLWPSVSLSGREQDGSTPQAVVETASQLPLRSLGNASQPAASHSRGHSPVTGRSVTVRGPTSHSRPPRGGRSGGLNGDTRRHANEMRKVGACWICAFQRDQCDQGDVCTRCQDRNVRGTLHMLPCNRMHLSELVQKFLPATMNRQHRRDEITTFVHVNLKSWRSGAPIQVYLTCHGLGHFEWDLHEFEPSSQEFLLQKRYHLSMSGTWQRIEKRSPPLALKELNNNQTHKLESYVENIIDKHLEEFQATAYSEEEPACAVFQSEILRALCNLYTSLPEEEDDKTLKGDLRQVIRMMVLTCIMDHPIAMLAPYQDTAISMMQSHNNPTAYGAYTSPMMANRQLKYFFSEMQTQQYNKSLNRLHQILRGAKDKNKLWMSSFVLMLGIALVLEQCQHLLWIKADAKAARRETTGFDAACEARGHCNEIDDGFDFLCKLYHCKYRGKHRQKTRYEELKHKTSNAAEAEFAETIYEIVDRNGGYLLFRQSLSVGGHESNNYFSRLVARFLVELMGLTQSSP